jgi:hypothetical protein
MDADVMRQLKYPDNVYARLFVNTRDLQAFVAIECDRPWKGIKSTMNVAPKRTAGHRFDELPEAIRPPNRRSIDSRNDLAISAKKASRAGIG